MLGPKPPANPSRAVIYVAGFIAVFCLFSALNDYIRYVELGGDPVTAWAVIAAQVAYWGANIWVLSKPTLQQGLPGRIFGFLAWIIVLGLLFAYGAAPRDTVNGRLISLALNLAFTGVGLSIFLRFQALRRQANPDEPGSPPSKPQR
jgi:hypothetical protein